MITIVVFILANHLKNGIKDVIQLMYVYKKKHRQNSITPLSHSLSLKYLSKGNDQYPQPYWLLANTLWIRSKTPNNSFNLFRVAVQYLSKRLLNNPRWPLPSPAASRPLTLLWRSSMLHTLTRKPLPLEVLPWLGTRGKEKGWGTRGRMWEDENRRWLNRNRHTKERASYKREGKTQAK